jgi:hypothetical protein
MERNFYTHPSLYVSALDLVTPGILHDRYEGEPGWETLGAPERRRLSREGFDNIVTLHAGSPEPRLTIQPSEFRRAGLGMGHMLIRSAHDPMRAPGLVIHPPLTEGTLPITPQTGEIAFGANANPRGMVNPRASLGQTFRMTVLGWKTEE